MRILSFCLFHTLSMLCLDFHSVISMYTIFYWCLYVIWFWCAWSLVFTHQVYGALRMSVKMFLMWNSKMIIDGGEDVTVATSLLEASNLVVLKVLSHCDWHILLVLCFANDMLILFLLNRNHLSYILMPIWGFMVKVYWICLDQAIGLKLNVWFYHFFIVFM
jgi:hypothetical protein